MENALSLPTYLPQSPHTVEKPRPGWPPCSPSGGRLPRPRRSGSRWRVRSNCSAALSQSVSAYERDIVQDALKTARGNRARAAKLLDTTERIVGYKIRKYGIDCERFR